jgi:small neutral amino acid transporter SnatA (MarC family)
VGIVLVLAVGLSLVMSGFYRKRGDIGAGNRRDVLIALGVTALLGLLAFLDWFLESPISVFGMYCGAVYVALLDKTGGVRKFHWVMAFLIEAASILPLFGISDDAADIAGEMLVLVGGFVAVTGVVDHIALGRPVQTATA